jgi:hypothetical protein
VIPRVGKRRDSGGETSYLIVDEIVGEGMKALRCLRWTQRSGALRAASFLAWIGGELAAEF